MPTESLKNVLDRDLSRVAASENIEKATRLLQELVNHSTHAFRRCEASSDGSTADKAFLMLYLHSIEMTDGIEALLAQGCVAPAIPLVRSAFEADLSLRFILQQDSDRRALAWVMWNLLEGISVNKQFDPSTDDGRAYEAACSSDATMQRLDQSQLVAGARHDLAEYQRRLAAPEFAPLIAEHGRMVASGKRYPKWYSLFGGPKNLRELSRVLQNEGQYLVVYGQWSRLSHAEDYGRFERRESADKMFLLIRDISELNRVASFAAVFLLRATRLILKKFRPSESLREWYLSEVRDLFWAVDPHCQDPL